MSTGAAVSRGRRASSPPAGQRAATGPGAPSQKNAAIAVPEVARRPRRTSAPVVVRGLGRHLELQEAAKRKKGLAEERAAEVFSVRKSALEGRAGLYTVPQPFALSTDQRSRCVQSSVSIIDCFARDALNAIPVSPTQAPTLQLDLASPNDLRRRPGNARGGRKRTSWQGWVSQGAWAKASGAGRRPTPGRISRY